MTKSDATNEIERISYTVAEAAAALGIDKERMGGLVRAGTVPHTRLGSRVLIGKRALEQWLTECCAANARVLGPAGAPSPTPLLRRTTRRTRLAARIAQ